MREKGKGMGGKYEDSVEGEAYRRLRVKTFNNKYRWDSESVPGGEALRAAADWMDKKDDDISIWHGYVSKGQVELYYEKL